MELTQKKNRNAKLDKSLFNYIMRPIKNLIKCHTKYDSASVTAYRLKTEFNKEIFRVSMWVIGNGFLKESHSKN